MAEEESESAEEESVSQFDILERINNNLESIHGFGCRQKPWRVKTVNDEVIRYRHQWLNATSRSRVNQSITSCS